MIDKNLNNFVCNLIWLIDLANNKRSYEFGQEIDEVVSFLYEHMNDFCTDKRDMFLDCLQKQCDNLGQMRYEVDLLKIK